VSPDEDIIPIKGVNYTVNALMQEEVEAEKCLVISIFMSYLDVHINRMPTDGFLSWDKLDALKVANLSMREVEREIVSQLKVHCANIQYALYNERVKNRIFHSDINQPYYLIQIADYEVDVITHFGGKCQYYTQGERFSLIRMGSQVDLIIPFINPKIKFESLVESKILSHVEAGLDPLIRWSKNA
jgi:phosphatidylserine decarboxylase